MLFEFCQDMLTRAPRSADGHCELAPEPMALMLAEITDPWRRRELMRLMIEAIRADDRVARGESVAFWQALDAWGMTLSDLVPSLPAAGPAKAQPNAAHQHAGHRRMRRLAARPGSRGLAFHRPRVRRRRPRRRADRSPHCAASRCGWKMRGAPAEGRSDRRGEERNAQALAAGQGGPDGARIPVRAAAGGQPVRYADRPRSSTSSPRC
ncbi:MAG: hypothetical protein MZW92_60705 [Comamonadaceae bacterium]|nr:hypothetical protein [Comamonadaceae bacterium]